MAAQNTGVRPEESPFPPRPSLGTKGRAMRPLTNSFELILPKKPILYQLDVKFSETRLPPEKRREVFQQLQIKYPKMKLYYDGTAIAATNAKFEGDAEIFKTEVTLPSSSKGKDGSGSTPITVTMKIVNTLHENDLNEFLKGKHEQTPKSLSYLNLLNIYLFHFAANDPGLAAFERTRSFFMLNNNDRVSLSGGLDLLFGGFMSVRWSGVDLKMKQLEKLYLNVDTVASTFYSKGPLIDRLQDILPRANLKQKLSQHDHNMADKTLRKLRIMTNHRPNWKKKYIINGLSSGPASQTFFEMDGKKISVVQYFKEHYSKNLEFPNLPCVVVNGGPDGKMNLPIEICQIPEGMRHRGHLTGMQTSDIIKKTATKPSERSAKIQALVKTISNGLEKDNSWGIKLSDKMAVVDARVLPEPEVQYGGKTPVRPKQGSWNTVGLKFTDPKKLDGWAVIDFRGDSQVSHNFVAGFVQNANSRGMSVNPKPFLTTANPNANLEQILNNAAANTPNLQMFFFILPMDTGTLYPALKRIADCNMGVVSQCLVYKKLQRANDQYYSNIALKVNHKLGGTNNSLKDKLPLFDKPTMIMGADVTHPSGGSNAPSIASVVGSVTADANLYVAKLGFQKSRKEYIDKFEDKVLHLLNMFKSRSSVLPERIIYYRDGVGEGMFQQVKKMEIAGIINAFNQVSKPYPKNIQTPNYRPNITMVVVQKRHHARFFPASPNDADRSQNCPAGMVVETGITHPREYDFYLQSQAGLQGTSRPTHYHVLHDENKFTPDSLQELTYRMCYLQGRSTRSVSIVPAVYHADLVCFRARAHLKDPDAWSQSSSGKTSDVNPEDLGSKISDKLDRRMWWM